MRLHEQRNLYRDRLADLDILMRQFAAYIQGPKFCGTDPRDGMPNSQISTDEVLRWMQQNWIPVLHGERDEVLGSNHDALAALTLIPPYTIADMERARARVSIDDD